MTFATSLLTAGLCLATYSIIFVQAEISTHFWKQESSFVRPQPPSSCTRECVAGAPPLACYYEFVEEFYHVMGPACGNCSSGNMSHCYWDQCVTADGYERGVLTINRRLAGPSIQVCKGDKIFVDVYNMMGGNSDTVHWHGFLQRDTPHMDGVPMMTQCPIMDNTIFQYEFWAADAGTFFYHSHSGLNKVDGLYGSVVVREPKEDDVNGHLYDLDLPEHTITLSDWIHVQSATLNPGLVSRLPPPVPDNLLINGRGQYTNSSGFTTKSPLANFMVSPGKKYRFRLINSASLLCGLQFTIQDHDLLVIALDKSSIEPVKVKSLITFSGERYDFVLDTRKKSGTYWIHLKAVGACSDPALAASQAAVLIYDGSETEEPKSPKPTPQTPLEGGLTINHEAMACDVNPDKFICPTKLRYKGPEKSICGGRRPMESMYYGVGFRNLDSKQIFRAGVYNIFRVLQNTQPSVASINNKTMMFPSSPLLYQFEDPDLICNEDVWPKKCRGKAYCECVHVVSLKRNRCYDLVYFDINGEQPAHPMHLHGMEFEVVGMGTFKTENASYSWQEVREMDRKGLLPTTSNIKAVRRDVVTIPVNGWVKIRIFTDNPGIWLMHCHFQYHMAVGMQMAFHVQGDTASKIPGDFPRCGNYRPNGRFTSQIYRG